MMLSDFFRRVDYRNRLYPGIDLYFFFSVSFVWLELDSDFDIPSQEQR